MFNVKKIMCIFLLIFVIGLMYAQQHSGSTLIQINFQPEGETPPEMLGDFGNIYGERGNGYEYGWLSDACIHAVKRDMYIDTIYDTFINLQNDSIWEIQLPEGYYLISVIMGDPAGPDQINNAWVEGVLLNDTDGFDHFDEYRDFLVTVNDGRLTIFTVNGAQNAKINYIEIAALEDPAGYEERPVVDSCSTCTGGEDAPESGDLRQIPPDVTPWIHEAFDPLNLGPLDGQNGWVADSGCGSPLVIEDFTANPYTGVEKICMISPTADEPLHRVNKAVIHDPAENYHTFEFDVRVETAVAPSEAKIEVQTDQRPGEEGKWAFKKFQIYFGTSMRLNYYYNRSVPLLQETNFNYWYHIEVHMNLATETFSISISGRDDGIVYQQISHLPMGTGPITNISISSWERGDYAGQDHDENFTGITYLDNIAGFTIPPDDGHVWCVSAQGISDTTWPCRNEQTFLTIQEAIDIAGNGDSIHVAGPTRYYEPGAEAVGVINNKTLAIIGGFNSSVSWEVPQYLARQTWINGQGERPALLIRGNSNLTLSNITLLNGGVIRQSFDAASPRAVYIPHPQLPVLFRGNGTSNDRFIVHGEMRFDANTHILQNNTSITGPGQAVVTVGLACEGNVEIDNILLTGNLFPYGDLIIHNIFSWNNGSIIDDRAVPAGRIILENIMNINSYVVTLNSVIVDNEGIINWIESISGSDYLSCIGPAVINNQAGATFNIVTPNGILRNINNGTGVLNNYGTVIKSGEGACRIGITFSGGDVFVEEGCSLILNGSGTATGSMNVTVETGAELDLTGGSPHTYGGTLTGTGAGNVIIPGNIVSIAPEGLILDCEGSVFEWLGGIITAEGAGALNNVNVMNIISYLATLDRVIVDNEGTINWLASVSGSDYISCQGGAVEINNEPGAIFDIITPNGILRQVSGGEGVFTNNGTVIKSGDGTCRIGITFSGGDVLIEEGCTLTLNGSGTATGSMNVIVEAGAELNLTGGLPHTYGGILTARGAGNVTIPNNIVSIAPEGLILDCEGSVFEWQSGTITAAGTGALRNIAVMNIINYNVTLDSVIVDNEGTINWLASVSGSDYISCQGIVEINNEAGAIFDMITPNGFLRQVRGGTGFFTNNGSVVKSGAGICRISITFSGGNVLIEDGCTLTLNGVNTSTGSMNVTVGAGAELDLTGGSAHTYGGTITASGDGNVTIPSSTVSIAPEGLVLDCDESVFEWQGGTITPLGSGSLRNINVMNIIAYQVAIDNLVLDNEGTINWLASASSVDYINCYNNSVINNVSSALFTMMSGNGFIRTLSGGSLLFNNYGILEGEASIDAVFLNAGIIRPGLENSTGTISFQDTFAQTTAGVVEIELESLTQFDTLDINSSADYNGIVDVSGLGGYVPSINDQFIIITHNSYINTLALDVLDENYFTLIHNPTEVVLECTDNVPILFNYGDVNNDDRITSTDISITERHVLGMLTLEGGQFLAGDVNGDDRITSTDISLIERYVLGMIDTFPAEE